jgi:asparagine synthetase B (glutamine-hydrolysing)
MKHISTALFSRPGLLVISNAGVQTMREQVDEAADGGASVLSPRWLEGLSAISVALLDAGKDRQHSYRTDDGVQVAFDGYLSDITTTRPADTTIAKPAQMIASLYRQHGIDFLQHLRGSFNCVVLDTAHDKGWLFNDRFGSRPMFYAGDKSNPFIVAPRTSDLAQLLPASPAVDQSAVGAFLVSAAYYGNQTLFADIKLFPQAGIVELGSGKHEVSRYWRMQFHEEGIAIDEAALLDECDALLEQAVRRGLTVAKYPVLAISGGVDSRILLSYLQRVHSGALALVSYGKNVANQNDLDVARKLAKHVGLPLTEFIIDPSRTVDYSHTATWNVDGRADLLDAASLTSLWAQLAEQHDGMVQGDQCFGWHGEPSSAIDALDLFGRVNLDEAPRLAGWIDSSAYKQTCRDIADNIQTMLPRGSASPEEIRDVLFFEQAIGVIQNAFASARRVHIEQIRPLMDEDVLVFVARLPASLRQDKALLRRLLGRFPEFRQVPLANAGALPLPTDYVSQKAEARSATFKLLREQFSEGLHEQLASWIDVRPVMQLLDALEQSAPLPLPPRRWYEYVPGFSGRLSQRLARSPNPFLLIRRLAAQDMYLKLVSGS